MKKILYFLLTFVFSVFLGCSNGNIREEIIDINEPQAIVDVTIRPLTEQELLDNVLVGFTASVKNKTNESLTIIWSDSTITYDGHTSTILINPMTYEPLIGKIEPNTIVKPMSTDTYRIYPADNLNLVSQNKYYGPEFFAIRAGTVADPDRIILFLLLNFKGEYKFVRIEALTEKVN